MIAKIRLQLESLQEEKYGDFNRKLLPGVEHILGIRLPVLRQIAKEIAREDVRTYLNEAAKEITRDSYYEEIMLQGLVLGYAKLELDERTQYLDEFVPKIQSWGICDSCTMSFKFMQKNPQYWWDYILKYRDSNEEYELRFMLISMLAHFIDQTHIDAILQLCNEIKHDGYYVKMGLAWLVSVCYIKYPEETTLFLKENQMDDFTHNKSIQKIRESYRVDKKEKDKLNMLKRKTTKKNVEE